VVTSATRFLRRRGLGPLRFIAASALLVATFAGNFAAHDHSIFSAGDGSARSEDRTLSRHNPLSRASHWHAVIAVVHEHACVACKNQRLVGLPVQGSAQAPSASTQAPIALRPARERLASLSPPGARAPPISS